MHNQRLRLALCKKIDLFEMLYYKSHLFSVDYMPDL